MTTIYIRKEHLQAGVDTISFADAYGGTSPQRSDAAIALRLPRDANLADAHIFICTRGDDYFTIRRSDIGNLIEALQKAQEIWPGCK